MATITLKRTGDKMPLTGFGLWKVDRATCADTVEAALAVGYRLLDGAGDYGNEKEAGEGLARAIKKGIVKREDVFVTSKLWNCFHAPEHVAQLARYQLKLWGIDYFDLFLVHFPVSLKYVDPAERYPPEWWGDAERTHVNLGDVPLQATWKAMETLVDEGLVRNIGVSNYNGGLLLDLQRYARIEPAVLQIEHHPYLVQQPLLDLAKIYGIAVTAYSSYGPQTWLELNMHHSIPSLFENDVITSIAQKHGKTPANVLLRWATQRGLAVIPKSNSPARVKENFQATDFDLTAEEIKQITSLDRGLRLNDPASIDGRLSIFA